MNSFRRAFTLLELLVVIAIMALLGTASVASYRSMQLGMQDSSVIRNASQFVRLAYQRSKIERVPVNVYFWNETRRAETDNATISVVGRAVAVRRHGRISSIDGKKLIDEFGDLDVFAFRDDEGQLDDTDNSYENDAGMYLYRINGQERDFGARSKVSRTCVAYRDSAVQMISYPDTPEKEIVSYGFYVQDGTEGQWRKSDAYGLEFGDFEMPEHYLFGTTYSQNEASPIAEVTVFNFNPLGSSDGGGQTIQVSAMRPNAQGELTATGIGKTVAPNRKLNDQNQ